MSNLGLQDWGVLAQLILTMITLIGIVTSLFISVRALREVQEDRKQRQRPHLAFEPGGLQIHIEFVKAGKAIPGINPDYVARIFADFPDDAESVRIKNRQKDNRTLDLVFYGQLRNYGLGPALETHVI